MVVVDDDSFNSFCGSWVVAGFINGLSPVIPLFVIITLSSSSSSEHWGIGGGAEVGA